MAKTKVFTAAEIKALKKELTTNLKTLAGANKPLEASVKDAVKALAAARKEADKAIAAAQKAHDQAVAKLQKANAATAKETAKIQARLDALEPVAAAPANA